MGFATTGAFRDAFMPKRATTIPVHRSTMAAANSPHAMDAQTQRHATTIRHSQWRMDLVLIRDVQMWPLAILMGLLVSTTAAALILGATIPWRATLMLLLDVMMDLASTRAALTLQHAIGMKLRVATMAVVRTRAARLKDSVITMPWRVATMAVVKTSRVLVAWIQRLAISVNT